MAITRGPTGSIGAGGVSSQNVSVAPTAGSLIVACCQMDSSNTASASDNIDGSTGWSTALGPVTNSQRSYMFYKMNCPSGITTVTVTYSGSQAASWHVGCYPGAATAGALDLTQSGTGTSTAPDSGALQTPAQNDELLVCFITSQTVDTGQFTNGTTGTTPTTYQTVTTTARARLSDIITTSAGSGADANGTLSGSAAWTCLFGSFRAAAAAGQDTPELYGRPHGNRGARHMHQVLAQ